ncbi:MAG: hypothetical protein RJB38_1785 [Pseudomonadota bacterium]|jgi:hypothetical protein
MTKRNLASTTEQRDDRGQAITEYVLLLLIILSLAGLVKALLVKFRIADKLLAPVNQRFVYVYRYGHEEARGFEDGGPRKHPRADGENSFRLFLNPEIKK